MDLTPKAKEGKLFKFPHPEAQKRHLPYDPSAHKRLIESTLSTLNTLNTLAARA